MSKSKLSRREQLERWWQETGRTPMKRLSYVQRCAAPIAASSAASTLSKDYHRSTVKKEFFAVKREPRQQDEAAKRNKQTLRAPMRQLNNTRICRTEVKKRKKRETVYRSAEKAAMKELFQRDIDDTVREILADQEEKNSQEIIGRLDFEEVSDDHTLDQTEMSASEPEPVAVSNSRYKRRRSSAYYVDQELAFASSAICYSVVTPGRLKGKRKEGQVRRRRTHTLVQQLPASEEDDLVEKNSPVFYLTPVRRSTRKSRSMCLTPAAISAAATACYDSPSQVELEDISKKEGCCYSRVEVIPNHALDISLTTRGGTDSKLDQLQ